MAIAKRIIMNGNENTATDYIPYNPATNTEYWAYVNGVRIPHWVQENGQPPIKTTGIPGSAKVGGIGTGYGWSQNGYTYYCSSKYSGDFFAAFAFNGNTANPWVSTGSDNNAWIAVQFPCEMKNIKVKITNRTGSNYVNGVTAGIIYGMDTATTDTTKMTQLYSFSGRDGATKGASTTYDCKNYNTCFKYLFIKITGRQYQNDYVAIGEIEIDAKKAV